MKLKSLVGAASVYLRLAISISYLWAVADRLGFIGQSGQPHVSWGDWAHFLHYALKVMAFLPLGIAAALASISTVAEGAAGLLLLFGFYTRIAAIGSCLLSLAFAIAMALSFGIDSPLSYSVFTLSAASLLLATLPEYKWSIDILLDKKSTTKNIRYVQASL